MRNHTVFVLGLLPDKCSHLECAFTHRKQLGNLNTKCEQETYINLVFIPKYDVHTIYQACDGPIRGVCIQGQ
jgi:hypothetical protein